MERRAISTAISDLILSISSARCAYYGHYNWEFLSTSVGGFMIIAVAAGLGFLRFGRFAGDLHGTVSSLHDMASYVSAVAGLALIADGYVTGHQFHLLKWLLKGFVALGFLGFLLFTPSLRSRIKEVSSPISLGIIVAMCIFSCGHGVINYYGIIGSGCFVLGGLLMRSSDTVLGTVKAVDVFHYLAAVGTVMLAGGIRWKRYNC